MVTPDMSVRFCLKLQMDGCISCGCSVKSTYTQPGTGLWMFRWLRSQSWLLIVNSSNRCYTGDRKCIGRKESLISICCSCCIDLVAKKMLYRFDGLRKGFVGIRNL